MSYAEELRRARTERLARLSTRLPTAGPLPPPKPKPKIILIVDGRQWMPPPQYWPKVRPFVFPPLPPLPPKYQALLGERETKSGVNLSDIVLAATKVSGLKREDLVGPKRISRIARVRQAAMYVARQMTGLSFPEIGRRFNRDHTTVLHGYRRVLKLLPSDANMAALVEDIRRVVVGDFADAAE